MQTSRQKKQKRSKRKVRSYSGLWILLVAAAVLELTACVQYFYSRAGIKAEAMQRAESELKKAELQINVVAAQVETSLKIMTLMAERNLAHPDSMLSISRMIVERTPYMKGAAIAMREGYYESEGKWFEAYSHEQMTGDKSTVVSRRIGSAEHDYFQSEWYRNGLEIDSCWWCEPYYDDEGAKEMLVSCSMPIKDRSGEIVGVALADVSLAELQRLSAYLQIYPDSYYSIKSGMGIDIVTPPDTIAGRKYHIFTEDIDATGWKMEIIIPDDVIFAELNKVGFVVTIMMIIGLALLIFIMYHSAKDILNLIKINSQNERIEGELNIARNIQMAMLPKVFPPYNDRQDLNIYGMVLPAKEVGGDLYDFYIRDNKLFVCIGDVSGKGVPASLVMAVTRSLFRTISFNDNDAASIVSKMNDAMAEMNEQNMFVTLFLGVLNLKDGRMEYCNAGHNAPILYSDGKASEIAVKANLPLGILSGFAFESQTTTLNSKDTLFLYTDGLSEAENSGKLQFGTERVLNAIEQWGVGKDAKQEIESMETVVKQFAGDAEQSDDLTMVSIHYLPENQKKLESKLITERYSLVMRNDIQQIPTLSEWVESLGVPDALNMTINLALEEAVSNVMLYAYPDSDSGRVLVEAEKKADSITFTITDSGIAFDPTKRSEPDINLPAEERQIGGLGIHLVKQIMDEVKYERKDGKNILTLVKNL